MNAQVLEGELVDRANDGIDEQQGYRFEEFRSSSAGQDSSLLITVYRHPSNPDGTAVANGKLQYMFQLPIDQLTREQILDKVAREYMTDTDTFWYVRIHIRQPGKRGVLFNELSTVLRQPKAPDTSQHGTDVGILTEVGKMLSEAQARTDALFSRLMEQQRPQPQINPIDIFLKAQEQSSAMFERLAVAMRGPTPTAGVAGPGGMNEALQSLLVFKQIKELMGDMGGAVAAVAGGDSNATADIIKAIAPMATPFLGLLTENLRAKNKQTLALPAPAAAAPTPAAPTPAQTPTPAPITPVTAAPAAAAPAAGKPTMQQEDKMLYEMREQLGQLADIISPLVPVEAVGAQILEQLPEAFDDPLYSVLSAPNWFERLAAVQNKLQPHREWMTRLRDFIIASFEDDDAPEAANDSAP